MTQLEEYYNKFNEEKRFDSRHGQVEYRVSMKYIRKYLEEAVSRRGGQESDPAARHRGGDRAVQRGAGGGRL